MRNHRQLGTIGVSTLILLAVLTSNGVWAGQPHVALSPPLSPLEQAARLAGVASQAMGRHALSGCGTEHGADALLSASLPTRLDIRIALPANTICRKNRQSGSRQICC